MSRRELDHERVLLDEHTTLSEVNTRLAELASQEPERATMVRPPRLPATPGQSFTPEPDARAREALEGIEAPERFTLRDAIANRP